jgi:glutamyl-tRNA reductase
MKDRVTPVQMEVKQKRIMEAELKQSVENDIEIDLGHEIGEIREQLCKLAHVEMMRQRRHLGQLSPEQEREVEALLVSVIDRISNPVVQQMQRSYDAGQIDHLNMWRSVFVFAQ